MNLLYDVNKPHIPNEYPTYTELFGEQTQPTFFAQKLQIEPSEKSEIRQMQG